MTPKRTPAPATRSATSATRSSSSPRARARNSSSDRARRQARYQREAVGEEQAERHYGRQTFQDARRSYAELKRAILAQGGIRPNKDYGRDEIPPDLRRRGPRAKSLDELPLLLQENGYHFAGDVDLHRDIWRRRERAEDAARDRPRAGGREIVCMNMERDARGRFVRTGRK